MDSASALLINKELVMSNKSKQLISLGICAAMVLAVAVAADSPAKLARSTR